MQNQDIELITRLVMEAIQEQAPSEQGFAVPVGVSKTCTSVTGRPGNTVR